ncbi:MAG: succinate dehydrogenase assembly factor 2 [Pseudomonadota bacterium]
MIEESHKTRLKRLRIRSWRRGTREMDLLLGAWADASLPELAPDELDVFEALLDENDHDLYAWVCGQVTPPERFSPLIKAILDTAPTPRGA